MNLWFQKKKKKYNLQFDFFKNITIERTDLMTTDSVSAKFMKFGDYVILLGTTNN